MARLVTLSAEHNSTSIEVTAGGTTKSVSTTQKRTGTYAFRTNPTANTGFFITQWANSSTTAKYFRAYLYIATKPGGTIRIIAASAGGAGLGSIKMTAAGKLQLFSQAGAQVGNDSEPLSTDVWYRIEFLKKHNTATNSIEGRINGESFAIGNDNTSSPTRMDFGCVDAATADLYWDDIACNDTTGSNQTGYPGEGHVIVLRPNAAGDSNAWKNTSGGAGTTNNYTLVDEVTPNTSDYVTSAAAGDIDMYNLGASGLSGKTITLVQIGVRFRDATADAVTAFKVRCEKAAAGTVLESAAIVPNSTTMRTNTTSASDQSAPLTLYTDPDGTPWTDTTLDSMQVGLNLTAGGTYVIRVTAIWAVVEYTDPQVLRDIIGSGKIPVNRLAQS